MSEPGGLLDEAAETTTWTQPRSSCPVHPEADGFGDEPGCVCPPF